MHIRGSRLVTGLASGALIGLAVAPSALAGSDGGDHVTVKEGDSIQDAIDAADPGTTIHIEAGTYVEALVVTTDRIALVGDDAVLEPPDTQVEAPCSFGGDVQTGVCIHGELEDDFSVTDRVSGVKVSGLTVTGFSGTGLMGIGTEDLEVESSVFADNGGYGAASFDTEGTHFEHNVARDNREAGFYVGDSPESSANVEDNVSEGNELGFFFRSASHGEASDNLATGNCFGILLLADAPGPATNWQVTDNVVTDNTKECKPTEEIPPLSGAGIVLAGAEDFEVDENKVVGNDSDFETIAEGGIVVVGGFHAAPGEEPSFTGTPPTGSVGSNTAFANDPFDITWNEEGSVDFHNNMCETSDPDGLCN